MQQPAKNEKPVQQPAKNEKPVQQPPAKAPQSGGNGYIAGQQLPSKPTVIGGILIASKKYPLPSTYAPGESKAARSAFNQLAAAAKQEGIHLTAFSTYRSYDYQVGLYNRYVKRDGQAAADRYSARPGYSEHQTGLAFDIGEVGKQNDWASNRFANSAGGKWLKDNAHRFGFVMRYPQGKEHITGYMYESWHFRYVGTDHATKIYQNNQTIEEYLGIQ